MRIACGTRVEVQDEKGITIPLYSQGDVIEVNYRRSQWGYHIFVQWDDVLGGKRRETWVMRRNIKLVEEEVELANTG